MNETVGQYRVISLLGEGGMGAVYEAEDTLLDIKVALKSLKTDLTKQPELVERFREEAKIQVKLNNPHIVKLYTFMRDGDHYYMVMEYVEGRTLGTLVDRVGRFRYRDAIHLMLQALDGLEHAHRMGVIHRDIKLNNIMVTPDGTVKVMDFGIARVLGSRRLTRAGNIVGTLDYISPEALNGLEITPAADIYSCGVMLYKMVTGSLPFISENDFLLARMHVEVPPPPPTLHVPDLPKKLEELILKALAKAPANRFQTAGQMADALEQFLDNDDTSQKAGSGSNASFWPRTPPPRPASGSRGSGSDSGAGQQQQFRPPASSVAAAATANRRIEELMEQNRMREAMDLVQKSMQDFPDDTTLRDLRARIEREQRHYEADLRRSEQEIRGYLKRGLAEMALSAAEASLSRYSSEASLLELLEEAKQQVNEKQAKAKVADQLQEEIRPLLDEGRFGEAVAMVVEAISQHPDQPELSALLGRTIKAQKDSEKRKLIVECRKEAEKLKQEGQFDLAVARVEQTRLTHPDDPSLLTLLQQLLEARDEARRKSDLERVTRKVDELESAGRFEDAESALDIALRRFPRNRELIARREDIIGKIAAKRRAVDLESARKNVNFLKASGEWQDALAEIEAAIRRLGPDPLFDQLRKEVEGSRKSYENQMDASAERVRELLRSEKFAKAVDALKSLTKEYPNEPVFERLVVEAGQGLEAQRRKARLTMLLQNALDLVETDKPEAAIQLLSDSASEFHNDPELARGLQRAKDAQGAKARRLALEEASQKADRAARTEDWTTAVSVLRAAIKQYPGDAKLEDKLADFEVREAAKIRIDTRRRAEETCKREVSNLIEQRQWTQAVSKISGVLRQFPESDELQLLQSDVAERFAKWREEQEREDEVARIRQSIESGNFAEAAERIPVARQRFANASVFHELATDLEQARKEVVNRQARATAADRAMGLIASHHWTEAEELLSATERDHGRDERIANARSTLEAKHSVYQSKLLQTTNEVARLSRAEKWKEALAAAEKLRNEYPESPQTRALFDRTTAEFNQWRNAKELDAALEKILGHLEAERWDEADTALQSATQKFPESSATLLPLQQRLNDGRAEANRRRIVAVAVDQAKVLASHRQWSEALAELDRAEAETGGVGDPALKSARKSILSARKEQQEAVASACARAQSLMAAGKFEESLRELSKPLLDGEAAVEKLREQVRQAKAEAEHKRLLADTLAGIRETIQAKNWPAALKRVEAAEKAFPEHKDFAAFRTAIEEGERKQKLDARVAAVLSELSRHTDPVAAIVFLRQEISAIGDDPRLRDALAKAEKVQADRERELARLVRETESLLNAGKPDDAARFIAAVSAEWRQHPSIIDLEQRSRHAAAIAGAEKLIKAGQADDAIRLLEGLPAEWREQAVFTKLANEARALKQRQIEEARAKELSRLTGEVESLINAGNPAEAIRYLEGLAAEWRQETSLSKLEAKARDARRKQLAEEHSRELTRLVTAATNLVGAGRPDEAIASIDALPDEWRQEPAIVEVAAKAREASYQRLLAEKVAFAEAMIAAGQIDEAIGYFEALPSEWRQHPAMVDVEMKAREAAYQRALSAVLTEASALISAGKPSEAVRYLESLPAEWRQQPALVELTVKAEQQAREAEIARLVKEASTLVAAGKPTEAVRFLDDLAAEWREHPVIQSAHKKALEAVAAAEKKARDQEVARLVKQASALVAAGKPAEAVAFLDDLAAEWRDHPVIQSAHQKALDVVASAEKKTRDQEVARLVKEASALVAAGKPAQAVQFLDELAAEWREHPVIQNAHKKALEAVAAAEQKVRDQELARLRKEANALLSAGKAGEAAQFIEGLSEEWRTQPVLIDLGRKARETEQKQREENLTRLVSEVSGVLANGRPAEAVRLIEALAPVWRDHPALADLLKQAREAVTTAERQAFEQELQRLFDQANASLSNGNPAEAVRFLEGLPAEWREQPALTGLLQQAREAVRTAERQAFEQELQRLLDQANASFSNGNPVEAVRFIENLSAEWREQPVLADLLRQARDAVIRAERQALEQQLQRLLDQANASLSNGNPAEAIRFIEGLSAEWREQPALAEILKQAREAVVLAERQAHEQQLQQYLDQANASLSNGNPAEAIRFIEGLSAEWREQLALAELLKQAREAAAQAEQKAREQEIARLRKEVNALLTGGKPGEALRQIEALPSGFREHSTFIELNRKAQEAVAVAEQQAREKELARYVKEAGALLASGKPAEAIQYLERLDQTWRSQPSLADLEQKARRQQREAGIAQARRTIDDLMAQGATARAKAAAEEAVQAFPDAHELIQADQGAAASLQLEDRIRQLLDSQFLDEAIEVSKQGANFPAVAALAAEAERRRDELKKAAEAFEQNVRQAIREQRFDAAREVLDNDGGRFASTGTLRAELQTAEADQAKEDRLAGYRKRIDAAWESNDFQAADLEIQQAISSDPEEPEVLEWLSEHEKRFQSLRRQQRLAAAVAQANALSTQRRFKDALAELDRAESEDSGSEELKSARKAIVKARKQHQDAVTAASKAAQGHINAGKWEAAERELVNSDFDTEPEIERLRERVRAGLAEVERKRQFNEALTAIAAAISQRDWAVASQQLETTRQQFPGFDKELDPLAKQIAEGQRDEHRKSQIEAAIAEADRQNDPAKALHILEKAVQEYGSDLRLDAATEQHQKIRADREKQLAEMVAQARALLQNNQAAEAIQYLSALPAQWSQHPTLVQLASEASTAQQRAETQKREADIEAAARNAAEWLNEGGSAAEARNAAQQALQSFPGAAALLDIVRRADQALHFEARIHTLIKQGQFEEAEKTWLEGAEFPTVAALGNEIENRRADHKRKSETFEAEVQLLIREGRLDDANRRLQAEPGLAATFPALRAELDQAQLHRAAEQRLADYRQKIEQAWSTGNLAASDAEIQKAIKTDSGAAIVFDWLSEQERRTAAAEKQKKLDRLKTDCKRAMESNALDRAAELLDRITRDHPSDSTVVDLTLALQKQRELATRATESLNQAEEHLARQEFDEALNALNHVPAGSNWADPVSKLRQRIQTEKKQAGRGKKPAAAPSPEVTIPLPLPPAPTEPIPAEAASKGKTYAIIGAVVVLVLIGWFMTRGGGGAELSVSPDTLNLEGPDARRVKVESGTPGIDFVAEAGEPWIRLQEAAGKTPGSFTVQAVPGTLAPDTYKTTVKVYPKGKPSEVKQIRVEMKVSTKTAPRKALNVAPAAINISFQVTQPMPTARRLAITGVPSESVRARVSKGADWLSVAISPGAATVSFRLQGKAAGNYAGEVELSVEGGNTVRVPINLVINAAPKL